MEAWIVKRLSKYGELKTCKMVGENVATIVVTKGFSENAGTTFSFMKDCSEIFPSLPIMETCITEKDFAMIVLKSKK